MRIRAARLPDVRAIHALIERFVPQGILLPRSIEAIERDLDYFLVAVEDRRVVGCVSLNPYEPLAEFTLRPNQGRRAQDKPHQPDSGEPAPTSSGLAEIRSLAVADDFQGNGLGARLVGAALKKAKRLGIARVFAVTHSLAFFEKQGFVATALADLPEKMERDCCRCPRLPAAGRPDSCGQRGAMMILEAAGLGEGRNSKTEKRKTERLLFRRNEADTVHPEIVQVTRPAAPPS